MWRGGSGRPPVQWLLAPPRRHRRATTHPCTGRQALAVLSVWVWGGACARCAAAERLSVRRRRLHIRWAMLWIWERGAAGQKGGGGIALVWRGIRERRCLCVRERRAGASVEPRVRVARFVRRRRRRSGCTDVSARGLPRAQPRVRLERLAPARRPRPSPGVVRGAVASVGVATVQPTAAARPSRRTPPLRARARAAGRMWRITNGGESRPVCDPAR